MRRLDYSGIEGKTFGLLTVVDQHGREHGQPTFLCRCACGNMKILRGSRIVRGEQLSCGCLRRKHGGCSAKNRSAEWLCWQSLRARCEHPWTKGYARYGGRGIKICPRWRNSFKDFLADMGTCPFGYQIDRIDNNGNYEPRNCRWVSRRENMNNRECSIRLEMDGQKRTLTEWCEMYGAPYSRTLQRLNRGWTPERAIKSPSVRIYHFWG